MKPEPFRVDVPQPVLADLRERLARTRWPLGVLHEGGLALDRVRELTDYWQTRFDWRAQESALNHFAHFRQRVDGMDLHFIHERSEEPDAIPLMLLHGWPGSFVEMLEVIPLLRKSFHVVVPSLPGYGFSQVPTEAGCSNMRVAELMAGLMDALSYQRFAVQGGDWGAGIATWVARTHPERVIGIHLNYIPGSFRPNVEGEITAEESDFLRSAAAWADASGAYGHVQRTRPLTLAYGLADSPAGLAAWIVEKFDEWADPDIQIDTDRLLTNVMIYWVTNTIGSSVRLYLESTRTPLSFAAGERIDVPCAIMRCHKEMPFPPRSWIERGYNVQRYTEFSRGGHFAAMEVPDLMAEDISAFFTTLAKSTRT